MTVQHLHQGDREGWRILVRYARLAAGEPRCTAKAGAFRRACQSAAGYSPPLHDDRGAIFEKLRAWGDTWWWLTPEHRLEERQSLSEVAWCCAVMLGDDAGPRPEPPTPAAAAPARLPYRDDSFDEDAA